MTGKGEGLMDMGEEDMEGLLVGVSRLERRIKPGKKEG